MKPLKDSHLWHEITKGIRPLKHRSPALLPTTPTVNTVRIDDNRIQEFFDKHSTILNVNSQRIDERKRLHKLGKVMIEARLDLHGYTRQEAQDKLQRFVAMAHHDQLRWVLVITGKGHPDNPATLKKLAPQWFESMPLVTGYGPAKDAHGGSGAFYVRIKG